MMIDPFIPAVISAAGGMIGGGLMGALVTYILSRRASRRQLAIQLHERYASPEGLVARMETSRIRNAWSEGDRSCITFFIRTSPKFNSPDAEAKCSNGLTPHQNLSWVLHFYVSLQRYCEAGLVDAKLAAELLALHYESYRQFFREFCEEYRKQAPRTLPKLEPSWIRSLPKLESLFESTVLSPKSTMPERL
jgi:hypothetical protein